MLFVLRITFFVSKNRINMNKHKKVHKSDEENLYSLLQSTRTSGQKEIFISKEF